MNSRLQILIAALLLAVGTVSAQEYLQKANPAALRVLSTTRPGGLRKASSLIDVVIKTHQPSALTANGIQLESVIGDVATSRITPDALSELLRNPLIEAVEIAGTERPMGLNNSRLMNVDQLHRGILNNSPLRGDNVLVAIYDSGIDWHHRDFRDESDTTKTRILFVWDQTLSGGSAPEGFSYGVEYTQSDLNAELAGTRTGFVKTNDRTGHGTAVASVAAGSGTPVVGIAPNANLIIIKGGDNSFSEAKIIDGLNYIAKKADQLGRPVVVNLSLGSHFGAHDGSRLYEQAIDEFSRTPGRAVVVAAGNDGSVPMHAEVTALSTGDSATFSFTIPAYQPAPGELNDIQNIEFWYDAADSVSVTVVAPSGKRSTTVTKQASMFETTTEGTLLLANGSFGLSPLNGKRNGSIQLFDFNGVNPAVGTWMVVTKNLRSSLSAPVHFWITESHLGASVAYFDRTSPCVTSRHGISSPGNATAAITVGSIVATPDGNSFGHVSEFSSSGPRVDGVAKPELVAPGENVEASAPSASRSRVNGTSFAAPQVAGLAALMLQIAPTMTSQQLKSRLTSSTFRPEAIEAESSDRRGYGIADGLNAVRLQSGIDCFASSFIDLNGQRQSSSGTRIHWKNSPADQAVGFEVLRKTTGSAQYDVIASYKQQSTLAVTPSTAGFDFIDAASPAPCEYRVREVDELGRATAFGTIAAPSASTTGITSGIASRPARFELDQNFPNPFNPSTQIRFRLPEENHVSLRIFDVIGREVATLVSGVQSAGEHTVTFDGSRFTSGTYLLSLEDGMHRAVRKIQLVK